MAAAYVRWFQDPEHLALVEELLTLVHFQEEEHAEGAAFLEGVSFVITGSLEHFSNRNALRDEIEKAGGKVAGSVSRKTGYLINNDMTSTSGKNKKAQELGVPIIDEETIMRWLKKGVKGDGSF
jgi:DNA ligase (NAD+)